MNDTMKTILGSIGVFVGIIVLILTGFVIKDWGKPVVVSESETWTNAAAECWKGYERKSLAPSEKISIAKFCEDIEAKAKSAR